MATVDISVVVPVYNEDESLAELATEITFALESADQTFEVILIDDGSTDGSWPAIQQLHDRDARFRGIRLQRNMGKSAALAEGFHRAKGKYVATLDADLQDDPAEIPALVDMLRGGLDLVSGWKVRRQDPASKTIPSRFFNSVTRLLSGIPLHDFNCGLKAYRSEVVKSITLYGEMHRYIPLLAKYAGFTRIGEKEVNHRARKFGVTKFGFERYTRGFLDLVTVLFMTRFFTRPMHFFGVLGTLAFVGGFVISIVLSYGKIVHGLPLTNRPLLLLGAVLLLFGSQMFTTGLLGEMIVRQQKERSNPVAEELG